MNDEGALLAAIIAQPEEDTPRLVYADWLDEHDRPGRAELIRLQVELARVGAIEAVRAPRRDMDRYDDLRRRERELLAPERAEWLPGLPGLRATAVVRSDRPREVAYFVWARGAGSQFHTVISTEFRRGFLGDVVCGWDAWREHGDAIRTREPVTRVQLGSVPEFEEDEDDVWLLGDPAGVRIPWVDVFAELRADERNDIWLPAVLRCRYGKRIEFELPDFGRSDLRAALGPWATHGASFEILFPYQPI